MFPSLIPTFRARIYGTTTVLAGPRRLCGRPDGSPFPRWINRRKPSIGVESWPQIPPASPRTARHRRWARRPTRRISRRTPPCPPSARRSNHARQSCPFHKHLSRIAIAWSLLVGSPPVRIAVTSTSHHPTRTASWPNPEVLQFRLTSPPLLSRSNAPRVPPFRISDRRPPPNAPPAASAAAVDPAAPVDAKNAPTGACKTAQARFAQRPQPYCCCCRYSNYRKATLRPAGLRRLSRFAQFSVTVDTSRRTVDTVADRNRAGTAFNPAAT